MAQSAFVVDIRLVNVTKGRGALRTKMRGVLRVDIGCRSYANGDPKIAFL